jgi:hypothetical protein
MLPVCDLDQQYLLPPSLQNWLPENHWARFIAELLTRLIPYGCAMVVASLRRVEKAEPEDVARRYLAANQRPYLDDTLAHFRRSPLEALACLFVQALRLCRW